MRITLLVPGENLSNFIFNEKYMEHLPVGGFLTFEFSRHILGNVCMILVVPCNKSHRVADYGSSGGVPGLPSVCTFCQRVAVRCHDRLPVPRVRLLPALHEAKLLEHAPQAHQQQVTNLFYER